MMVFGDADICDRVGSIRKLHSRMAKEEEANRIEFH